MHWNLFRVLFDNVSTLACSVGLFDRVLLLPL